MKTILTAILASLPMIAWAACPVVPDTDGDGVLDPEDTCTLVANADQRDTDGDGFGNACDGDHNQDGGTNVSDLAFYGRNWGQQGVTDHNGDGGTNASDLGIFKQLFGSPPGPAGSVDPVACATTEDLQTTGGVMDFPWGTIAVAWQDMNPGETVSVYSYPTTLDLDAMAPAAPAFRVTAPQSLEEFTVDVGPAILAVRNAAPVAAGIPDTDVDGVPDYADNCTLVANDDQRDTDGDGFGNICDPDFNNNGVVDSFDFSLLKSRFGQPGYPDQDLNGNGVVDPFDFSQLKAFFGQPPGPAGSDDPTLSFTKEELQATGGEVALYGVGTLTLPWQDMGPGEAVAITVEPEQNFDADGTTPATPAFRVLAPESVVGFTVDLDVQLGDDPLVLAVRSTFGQSLDSEPFPWSLVDADGTSASLTFMGHIRELFIVPLFGQRCNYNRTDVFVQIYWHQPCNPEPSWLIDVVDAVRDTRTTFGPEGEGFPLSPVQRVIFLSGVEELEKAGALDGVNYVNTDWYNAQGILERQASMIHETFHSISRGVTGSFPRNWMVEATAVAAEWKVYPENTRWRERYPWNGNIVERGVGNVLREWFEEYNPFIFLYLMETDPSFSLYKFFTLAGPEIIANDAPAAFVAVLGTYETVRQEFAKAANQCHRDRMTGMNVTGLCGTGNLEQVNLDGPTLLKIGTTSAWSNMVEGDVELEVSGNPTANPDTLITLVSDDGSFSLSVDGALGDTYQLANLPVGDYTITVSSIEGTDFTALDEYVSVEMVREAECVGGGPWLFDGGESATAYYGPECADLGYNVNISETATSFICPDTPGIDEVGKFKVRFRFGGDIRELLWPGRVVGSRTNGSIPDEYWPTQFQQPPNPGGCDRLGVRAEAWYDIHSRNTYQTVTWYWNCADGGNCGSPEARPPSW